MTHTTPSPLRGAAAGLAAGLIASFAMNQFQKMWSAAVPMPEDDEPSTVKAAQKATRAAGAELAEDEKEPAGNAVHYLFGGGLGALYGLIAEYRPEITSGFGAPFGLGAAALFDEVAVPAAGLSEPPAEVPARQHLYGIASHLVYGGTTEGIRRLLRS